MCIETLAKMLLGRRRVIKLHKSWRIKKTADDKMCLLKDQDLDTEIHEHENTRDNHEYTENGADSYDLPEQVAANCDELVINGRLAQCTDADSIEGYKVLHHRRNGTSLENRDNTSGEIRTNDRTADIVTKNSNNLNDNETFLSKHLYRLIKKSRRLSQKSSKETDEAVEKYETELDIPPSEDLCEFSADSVEMQFKTLEERCRYYWNTNSDSDDESDLGDNDNDTSRVNDRSRDHDISCDSLSELDDTFIDTEADCQETNGVTEVSIHEEDSGITQSLDKAKGDAGDRFGYDSMIDESYSSDDSFADTTDCEKED